MVSKKVRNKQGGQSGGIHTFPARDEVCTLQKVVNDDKDRLETRGQRQLDNEVHANHAPRSIWDVERHKITLRGLSINSGTLTRFTALYKG